jgi:hypothetical protein
MELALVGRWQAELAVLLNAAFQVRGWPVPPR